MALSRLNLSPIGLTDSYKVTHHLQYPEGTTNLFSYFESRGGRFEETVTFGLYYILIEYLSTPITQADVDYFDSRFAAHFGDSGLYNRGDWELIRKDHGGLLPVRIRAVPEGTVVPTGNVLVTVENTDPRFPWLTNYLETVLCHLWYGSTVATLSREARKVITDYAILTGSDVAGVQFKLHDFGFRGASSVETAAVGGAAHLLNFLGTDTMIGYEFLTAYYGADMAGFSIPAAEHSTIMTWEEEADAFRNMIEQFGASATGIFAVVSDTYDIYNACDNLWGEELRHRIEDCPNMLVVRPDSGDVREVVQDVLDILGSRFGTTTNDQGFKVLNNVRVIQGDGMDLDMIEKVCEDMYHNRWAIDNIAFGMGAGLLQNVNRDTCKFAFKACSVTVDGKERGIKKTPVTDAGKTSKAGRLTLVRDAITEEYKTVHPDDVGLDTEIMETVFENGVYMGSPPTLTEMRERTELDLLAPF